MCIDRMRRDRFAIACDRFAIPGDRFAIAGYGGVSTWT